MNRLTEKSTNYDFYFPKKKVSILDLSDKLGKLEDLMEELNIDNVEELGEYIHDLNIYVGAYANDPPEKTQQIVKDLNTVAKLRKELGYPLEVVFDALKEGIIIPKEDKWYPTVRLEKFKIGGDWNFTWHCGNIKLSDYKKTWWLPSDKEWKDE